MRGKLSIENLELVNGVEEARSADWRGKQNIYKLRLRWSYSREEVDNKDDLVLEGLKLHKNLKSLEIKNLIEIRIVNCGRFKEIPILGQLPHLKYLYLSGLKSVERIGPSFYGATTSSNQVLGASLHLLEVDNCEKLTTLPDDLYTLRSLEHLQIRTCPSLESITSYHHHHHHHQRGQLMTSLCILRIWSCRWLTNVPGELLSASLEESHIEISSSLKSVSYYQRELPMPSLRNLVIYNCVEITSVPSEMLFAPLDFLTIYNCPNLIISFPPSDDDVDTQQQQPPRWSSLSTLTLFRSPKLIGWFKDTISTIGGLSSLRWFKLGPFSDPAAKHSYGAIFYGIRHFSGCLILVGCSDWDCFPADQFQYLTSLADLFLEDFKVESLSDWLGNLSSLKYLGLQDNKKLQYLPSNEATSRLTNLRHLLISYCPLPAERCKEEGSEWPKISHIPRIDCHGQY